MILADTSVWVDHFRGRGTSLGFLLTEQQILAHPYVVGELSLGHLRHRTQILHDLKLLPKVTMPTDDEVLEWVEKRKLFGKGIGWVDAHLLLSCLLSNAQLWTNDKNLISAARFCGAETHSGH